MGLPARRPQTTTIVVIIAIVIVVVIDSGGIWGRVEVLGAVLEMVSSEW